MYRNNINLDKTNNFGIEIEFTNIDIYLLYLKLLKHNIPVLYQLNHKLYNLEYDTWYLDIDSTVTSINNNILIGGELSSRILNDTISTWNEISIICDNLINMNACSSSNCSTHITVDVSNYRNINKFIEILYKIIIIYENELNLYYMGDSYLIRNTKNKYAKDLRNRLLEYYYKIDFNNSNLIDELKYKNIFLNYDAINFSKLNNNLIEVRYPNGTFNKKVIQNFINFTVKLFNAINKELFDIDKLNYIIDNKFISYHNYKDYDISLFMDLVTIISTNSLDEEDFFNQYQKIKTY